ncbi:MAG: hypothetical protein IH946_10410 [Bacteroidetes bacterium]|nr:hypothetical protein [Bacteroidota bacterium]
MRLINLSRILKLLLLSVVLLTSTNNAQAWKMVFSGSGGLIIEEGDIAAICPLTAPNETCAEFVCSGVKATFACLYLWVKFGIIATEDQTDQWHEGTLSVYEGGQLAGVYDAVFGPGAKVVVAK